MERRLVRDIIPPWELAERKFSQEFPNETRASFGSVKFALKKLYVVTFTVIFAVSSFINIIRAEVLGGDIQNSYSTPPKDEEKIESLDNPTEIEAEVTDEQGGDERATEPVAGNSVNNEPTNDNLVDPSPPSTVGENPETPIEESPIDPPTETPTETPTEQPIETPIDPTPDQTDPLPQGEGSPNDSPSMPTPPSSEDGPVVNEEPIDEPAEEPVSEEPIENGEPAEEPVIDEPIEENPEEPKEEPEKEPEEEKPPAQLDFSQYLLKGVHASRSNVVAVVVERAGVRQLWLHDLALRNKLQISADVAVDFPVGLKDGFFFWLSKDKATLYAYHPAQSEHLSQPVPAFDSAKGERARMHFPEILWEVIVDNHNFYFFSQETGEVFSDESSRARERFGAQHGIRNFLSMEQMSNLGFMPDQGVDESDDY